MFIKKLKISKLIKGIGLASLLLMVSLESSIANAATSTTTSTEVNGYTLLYEKFDSQTVPQNFGFSVGADVDNGVLNITKGTESEQTSVKLFDEKVSKQKKWVELSFDWTTSITASGRKTGVEFRDSAGNLIFAICGTYNELRYSYTGDKSDSSTTENFEPIWSKITTSQGYSNSEWYSIKFKVNFETKSIEYSIVKKGTGDILASGTVYNISGKNLTKMVAADYYSEGIQSIDNFVVMGGKPNILQGKTMYAFGDSIVAGHKYPLGFVDFVAKNEEMQLTKYARNGAVICKTAPDPMGGYIMDQVEGASSVAPDYVVFDGGTNDAEDIYNAGGTPLYSVGTLSSGKDPSAFDTSTFAGSFEKTIYDMENKWPRTKIVYVAVHKLGSRDWNTQLELREIELAACKKWGVTVADVFGDTDFDTRNTEMKDTYTFNNLTSSGLPGTNGSGTHPNFAGIEKYYLPVLDKTLLRLVKKG